MILFWTEEAIGDLNAIGEYNYLYNKSPNIEIKKKIYDSIEILTFSPFIGREGRVARTRELVLIDVPYIVAYSVSNNIVRIISIYHSSRDWPRSFNFES